MVSQSRGRVTPIRSRMNAFEHSLVRSHVPSINAGDGKKEKSDVKKSPGKGFLWRGKWKIGTGDDAMRSAR